jgi:hypothetical protein
MITGVRGSGKTVMLTDIAKHFRENEGWIVMDLSPERDFPVFLLMTGLYENSFPCRRKQGDTRLLFRFCVQ